MTCLQSTSREPGFRDQNQGCQQSMSSCMLVTAFGLERRKPYHPVLPRLQRRGLPGRVTITGTGRDNFICLAAQHF